MKDRCVRIGKTLFASTDLCEYAQWERGGCGLTLRVGRALFAIGRVDYRDTTCPWPKWLRFGACLAGPVAASMSGRRQNYLYLFGRRVFDTAYWEPRTA